jgi:hypothetical protein
MADHKSRGNQLYQAGDFSDAADAYTAGLSAAAEGDANLRSMLYSNRAACYLALGAASEAEADCRAGLALSPLLPKLHYRLAKALVAQGQAGSAAEAVAAAVALWAPSPLPQDMLELYQEVAEASAAAAAAAAGEGSQQEEGAVLLQLPADAADITLASSAYDLHRYLAIGFHLVVLPPGNYSLQMPLAARASTLSVLGLGAAGSVQLRCRSSHAAWVERGDVTLVSLNLAGSGDLAAVCVSPAAPSRSSGGGAVLRMLRCSVEDYPGGGVLVHGGSAQLEGCSFRRCGGMAVEVRQGGSLQARGLHIEQCRQGVTAYGGARSVQLYDCHVLRCQLEGILADGSQTNAATAAQAPFLPALGDRQVNQATQDAAAWGKAARLELQLVVEGGEVSHNCSFGLSLDGGCVASISGCRLEGNDPYAVYVKGGTDVCVSSCQLVYGSGTSSASQWAKQAKVKLRLAGGCRVAGACCLLVAGSWCLPVAAEFLAA